MDKKKIATLIIAGTLITTLLTGCSNTKEETQSNNNTTNKDTTTSQEERVPEKRTFQPGEHVFYVRYYNSKGTYSERVSGGQVEIPEGYEILDIENFEEKLGYGSQTGGYDVWFINNQTVEVEQKYNKEQKTYDYSQPGQVILLPTLEEEGPTLKLTP